MKLDQFKKEKNISELKFYSSHSGRYVASFMENGEEYRIVTRTGFDPNGEKYIYPNSILADPATGEIVGNLYWLSNEIPKEPAFTL